MEEGDGNFGEEYQDFKNGGGGEYQVAENLYTPAVLKYNFV